MADLMPLIITIPLAAILLLFCVVFAGAGLGLVLGGIAAAFKAIIHGDWRTALGMSTLGFAIVVFGFIVLHGSFVTGADIIDLLITRFWP